jgi:enoyl-CoA hydratase/carnithine racemase
MTDTILLEREERVATVTLNRPGQRNAINLAMWSRLTELAGELDADPDVRVVIFRGAGDSAFSAGADIAEFEAVRATATQAAQYAAVFDGALDAIANIGKPTLSLIRGFCVGGGLELASATDLRLAADDARFGVPIAQLGILVGYKEMQRLVALVGAANTLDLLLTARLINAAEALRLGLVTEVTPAGDVEGVTYSLARRLCGLAPLSARWHKQILRTVLANPVLSGLSEAERALPYTCFDTNDFQEGRRAFLEKRPPNFTGR